MTGNAFCQDASKGSELYQAKCLSCHGAAAEGSVESKSPYLAGQYDWYILSQIAAFKKGEQPHPKMSETIKALSDQDAANLALYLSKLQ